MTDRSPLTCALAPAREPRGSLQRELDEQIDRQTLMMQLAAHNGFEIEIREEGGRRFWFVPREFVQMVGCDAAVVW